MMLIRHSWTMPRLSSPIVRHLVIAQALYVGGSTVDLTLTGIVGARLAPSPILATLPFTLIFVLSGLSTFFISRSIGRWGHRPVFIVMAAIAVISGCVSAAAIQLDNFGMFCAGTALIGIYAAGAGYYRYLAADSTPNARAGAISAVLAGGLVSALVGPFAATALRDVTGTPFVASYLLVAVLGAAALLWNIRLPRAAPPVTTAGGPPGPGAGMARSRRTLWRQPALLVGVAITVLSAASMLSMMTAGPIMGMADGHTPGEAALAIQLHMVGMYAPGFIVARFIGRFGERTVALVGVCLLGVAGVSAASSTGLFAFLLSMLVIGIGWNLAYSGGSALIASSYRPNERGSVQPIAEAIIITAQVCGTLSAAAFVTATGWHILGIVGIVAAFGVGAAVVMVSARDDKRMSRPEVPAG